MSDMKSKLVNTLFGEVDLNRIRNNRLLRVIKNRMCAFSFLFNYGDTSSYTVHTDYSDTSSYRDRYKEYTEEKRMKHTHKHKDYSEGSNYYDYDGPGSSYPNHTDEHTDYTEAV